MEKVFPGGFLNWILRYISDIIAFSGVILIQAFGLWWILRYRAAKESRLVRGAICVAALGSFAAVTLAFFLRFGRVSRFFSPWWIGWGRGLIISWALVSVMLVFAVVASDLFPRAHAHHSPARRNFLRALHVALFGAPAAAVGYGVFIERTHIGIREETVRIPGLSPDLDGLRVAQLSDIHLSSFLPERVLEHAVGLANETRAHLALITGDLISFRDDPLDACLRHLARLRAEAGVFGCMGNHEVYAQSEAYTAQQGARLGMRFLRGSAVPLSFGNATLNLAGVDYQPLRAPYLAGAEKLIRPGAFNLLMSHNPDVFPVAARQGWDFTIGGHTHGGQVRIEILHQDLNVARFFTPYVDGLYRDGASSIYVSRGIGTIGAPVRLGSPPEVALLRLCRI